MLNLASLSAAASAVAHSQMALQANPPLPDPIGPVVHPGDQVALNPQPLPPREALRGGLSQHGSIAAMRAALDQAQLQLSRGIDKALIGVLFPPALDPLGHRRTVDEVRKREI
jgi:hypothetical protein